MPRTVDITLPSNKTDALIADIKKLNGILGIKVHRKLSLQPEGDVISLGVTDRSLNQLMLLLDEKKLFEDSGVSITTSDPLSIVSKSSSGLSSSDVNEATWEEMVGSISKQSNMTINNMFIMFLSGVLAVTGIITNALHIVIGAMVIAPGFEPVVRISLAVVTKSIDWRRGVGDTAKAYLALFAGALLTTVFFQILGKEPIRGEPSYLQAGVLVSYWTSVKVSSLLVTTAAGIGGALVIATNRSVLTAGVMIALAFVPAVSLVAMGLAEGNADIAFKGFLRWALDAVIVIVFSGIVFFWKKTSVYKRDMKA